jgi:hypothetical protein
MTDDSVKKTSCVTHKIQFSNNLSEPYSSQQVFPNSSSNPKMVAGVSPQNNKKYDFKNSVSFVQLPQEFDDALIKTKNRR